MCTKITPRTTGIIMHTPSLGLADLEIMPLFFQVCVLVPDWNVQPELRRYIEKRE